MTQWATIAPGTALIAALVAGGGCAIDASPDFDSPVPQDRYLAIRQAAEENDASALPDLVRQLDADDPLVRAAAIDALERITGETQGFDPHAGPVPRSAAIARWDEWIRTRDTSTHPQPEGDR